MQICCLNNYPLSKMSEMASRGQIPWQHAWGVEGLERAGHRMVLAPFQEPSERKMLARFSRRSRYKLGQLDQEWFALQSKSDAYYSADGGSASGLALVGHRPVVSVFHHPVRNNLINSLIVRGQTHIVCLSETVLDSLPKANATKRHVIPWGPDLESPLYKPGGEELGVVSAGKSNRDLKTLVGALAKTGKDATIYDTLGAINTPPPNVKIADANLPEIDPDAPTSFLANKVIGDIARAAIVAIPTLNQERLTGLTEINDALALGKPLIVTRNRFHPFDIEKIGCGVLVDPGDVEGWIAALHKLSDPTVRHEMGERGRRFAETSWNNSIWNRSLTRIFTEITHG